jgi:hypothetical protein
VWVQVTCVLDLTGVGVGVILHLRVASAPIAHRDRFGCGFSFTPASNPTGEKKSSAIFFTRQLSGPVQLGAHLNAHAQVSLCII